MGKAWAASLPFTAMRCKHAVTAPRTTPTSRIQRRSWGSATGEGITTVKTAPPARAQFWAWPNNASRLCVAQARGLLSVYKSRGPFLHPFTCARAVAAPRPWPRLAGQRKQRHKTTRPTPSRKHKEQKGEVDSPGKALAGEASTAPARALPGQLAQRQQGCHP